MAQVHICWPVTTEAQVQSHARSYGIYGGQSGTGTHFSWAHSFFSLSIMPAVLHAHLFTDAI